MTNKEFLTNVSTNNITAEIIVYATEALRKADEATAARSAAKNAEDAPMIETIVNTLTQNARDMFDEGCKYYGVVSEEWAEMQGFDTYSADTYC